MEKEFTIPINDEEQCKKINKEWGTNYKSTEEHLNDLFDNIIKMMNEAAEGGKWYLGDAFKIKVSVEYEPEDK